MTRIDRWTSIRTLLPTAWASLALLQSCAQVVADVPDAGPAGPPQVAQVDPAPGPVAADAQFRVSFSQPMDLSLLLSQPDRSESVVLVGEANVELIAAALTHGKLTAKQRALLVDATASAPSSAMELTLIPKAPLGPGAWYLLVSSHLKDTAGRKMQGNGARFAFSVARPAPAPRLEAPFAGSSAPFNLQRVRVSFPDGPAGAVTLVQRDGGAVAGPEPSDGGPLVLHVRSGGQGCSPLCPGGEYALAQDGHEVAGAAFRASSCARGSAPRWLDDGPVLEAGDTWVHLFGNLDWPAAAHLEVRSDDGSGQATLDVLVQCAPDACGADAGDGSSCRLDARLSGLQLATNYRLTAWAEDDEGNRSASPEQPFQTTGALPVAQLTEIMSRTPAPPPRGTGEYIEILNAGDAPLDPNRLALVGPDQRVRPIVGRHERIAPPLGPGERGLAVGSTFDPSRYQLDSSVPLWRCDTKKLLGRGLPEQPPAIHLVWTSEADGGSPVELDRYPGDLAKCPPGESIERIDDADGGPPGFECGQDGGTPGRPP